jgi:hypothetical protein
VTSAEETSQLRAELDELNALALALIEQRRQAPGADTSKLDELEARLKKGSSASPVPHVKELSAQTVRIVDEDGKLRIQLSAMRSDGRAGITFHGDDGSEHGGLTYAGATLDGEKRAVHELVYAPGGGQDALRLFYKEEGGRRDAGLKIEGGSGVFLGKEGEVSRLVLTDAEGRPRINLVVDGEQPRLEFLDESGRVSKTIGIS